MQESIGEQGLPVREAAAAPEVAPLLNLIRLSDMETYGHSLHVAEVTARLLALDGGPGGQERIGQGQHADVIKGALLHDLGKIFLPFGMAGYPGRIGKHKRKILEIHPALSYEAVKAIGNRTVSDICLMHHERADGSGYPDGISGGEIPECVHAVRCADVFCALISERAYKPAFREAEAFGIMRADAAAGIIPDYWLGLLLHGANEKKKTGTD